MPLYDYDQLPLTIYRAKGFVFLADMPDNKGVLHVVGKRVSLTFGELWGDTVPYSQIVVIGTYGGVDPEDLRQRFESALAINQPASEMARITDSVVEWMRARR